jgi:hypothetical protein
MKKQRSGSGLTHCASKSTRRRVTQEMIDQMAELRRHGLSFTEIGARVGCSDRTARRYVGHVEAQLQLPQRNPEPKADDPRQMGESLALSFSEVLYSLRNSPRPRESVSFLAESNRMIQERLAGMDPLTLKLLLRDPELRTRFLREVVGHLHVDFRSWIRFDEGFGVDAIASAASWLPPRERPLLDLDDDDL